MSFEYLQHLIAQIGIVLFEIAGLLGIALYLAKKFVEELYDFVVLCGKCRRSVGAGESLVRTP